MSDKLGAVRTKDVERVLVKLGYVYHRQQGSHRHYKYPERAMIVTVPAQGNKPYHDEPLSRMLRQMGLSKREFTALLRER